jgi:hypothetical protein
MESFDEQHPAIHPSADNSAVVRFEDDIEPRFSGLAAVS